MERDKEQGFTIINLKPAEITNPLLVLAEFFQDDWLPGHLERLQSWRRCVLEEGYFKGDKGSPAELLCFHRLNVCLLEAAYLLKDTDAPMFSVSPEQERNTWRDYPNNLNEIELLNPYLVLIRLFNDYNLLEYREMLYEWLEYGLSISAAKEFIEAKDLIKVYENLQKLYSAAWLIYQRSANEPYLQTDKEVVQAVYNIAKQNTAVSLFTLNPTINAEEQEIIKSLVSIIKHKVPSVQAVIYLGTSPVKPDHIFLLVFTNSEESRQAHSLCSMIEECCAKITTVTALVHDSSILFRANDDNLFFSKALRCPVVFLSGDLLLPVLSPGNGITGNKAIVRWDRWFGQGKEFLNGAEYYMTIGADNAALFSLHQCAECLLVAIIRAVTGYGINVHNLKKLLDLTLIFTTDIANVFELEKADNLLLFNQLKHAYIDIRYRDTFEVDPGYTAKLYQCIRQLLVVTEKVYQKHLLISSL